LPHLFIKSTFRNDLHIFCNSTLKFSRGGLANPLVWSNQITIGTDRWVPYHVPRSHRN